MHIPGMDLLVCPIASSSGNHYSRIMMIKSNADSLNPCPGRGTRSAVQGTSPRCRVLMAMAVGLVLLGCASQTDRKVSEVLDLSVAKTDRAQSLIRAPQTGQAYVLEDQLPRFASRTIPVEQAAPLPYVGMVTARYPGRHTLLSVADVITRLTQIPVIVTPDALLPLSQFAPGRAVETATDQGRKSAQANQLVGAGIKNLPNEDYLSTFELNYTGHLAGLLDSIAKRGALQWKYDAGTITFSRVVSRSFVIKSLSGGLKTSGSLKLTPGDAGSSLDVDIKSESDVWANLRPALESLVSRAGSLIIQQNIGVVQVRDAISNVREVQRYIENLNASALRQVSLNVEVLQVELDEDHQRGIDWNFVSRSLSNLSGSTVSLQGPPSILPSGVTSGIGLTLSAANSASGATGQALVRALEQFGRVSSAYSSVVTTTNRVPAPIGVQNQTSYLKSVSPGVSTSVNGISSVSASTLTPGQLSTGFVMTVTPLVLDSNKVLLEAGLSISRLRKLSTFTSGSGASVATIQLPEIDVFNMFQRATLIPGETLVLAGYEAESGSASGNDVVKDSGVGFRVARRSKISTVILITPRLQDV